MTDSKKLVFFLPNTFTALNMACGYASILFSFNGNLRMAGMILLLGAIFDSVDGRVARLTGTESSFGEQFDSISDVISFGIAPAILSFHCFFSEYGRLGVILSFIYLLCGALRLARFNANIDKVSSDFFQGLPIPSGALFVIGLVLFTLEFPTLFKFRVILSVSIFLVSLLMISNVPFCSFKNSSWISAHKKLVLVIIFLLIALIILKVEIMIFLLMSLYILSSLIYFFINRGGLGQVFMWKSEKDD